MDPYQLSLLFPALSYMVAVLPPECVTVSILPRSAEMCEECLWGWAHDEFLAVELHSSVILCPDLVGVFPPWLDFIYDASLCSFIGYVVLYDHGVPLLELLSVLLAAFLLPSDHLLVLPVLPGCLEVE